MMSGRDAIIALSLESKVTESMALYYHLVWHIIEHSSKLRAIEYQLIYRSIRKEN